MTTKTRVGIEELSLRVQAALSLVTSKEVAKSAFAGRFPPAFLTNSMPVTLPKWAA